MPPWTNVSKPATSSVVAVRGQYYGFGAFTYSGNEVIGANVGYTSIAKPTGASYTNVLKPTGGALIQVGMITGLLIPLTHSRIRSIGSPWTNVLKPT